MLKLMKYEFRKTLAVKLILLGVTAAVEIAYLISLSAKNETGLTASILLLVLLATGGIMMMGLSSVVTLHRDMNTKQSYMLFMTPNSCHAILGAKMLECGLSILIAGAFYFALGTLDISLLLQGSDTLHEVWNLVQNVVTTLDERIRLDTAGFAAFLFNFLSGWIVAISAAFLADVVSTALLYGKKYNGVLSFVLFLALSWLINSLSGLVSGGIGDFNTYIVVKGLIGWVLSGIVYLATAQIMERKLSV